jgi:site-specific recombinase XerD
MASLKKTKKSPYWILRRRDPQTGDWRDSSTGLRHAIAADTQAARRLAHKASQEEQKLVFRAKDPGHFARWVPDYLAHHYDRASTRRRAEIAWANLAAFLTEKRLTHPRQVRYEHAEEFMQWRKAQGVGQNTARMEAKFLAFLLNEAMRREYVERNVIALAKIRLAPVKVKPDLTTHLLAAGRAGFAERPAWMRHVFEIMMATGCRFSEASMPLTQIDFERDILYVSDAKRQDTDPRKLYPVPLPPALRPLLEALRASGAKRTAPALTREDNRRFNIILKQATGATSHSLRVSFISRCHRAGLSEMQAMRLVNHSSQLVHRIYSRLSVEDMRSAMLRLPAVLPPPALPETPSPSATSSCDQRTGTQDA